MLWIRFTQGTCISEIKIVTLQKTLAGEEKASLAGLGYVGMPIAPAFAGKGIDVKEVYKPDELEKSGLTWWRL